MSINWTLTDKTNETTNENHVHTTTKISSALCGVYGNIYRYAFDVFYLDTLSFRLLSSLSMRTCLVLLCVRTFFYSSSHTHTNIERESFVFERQRTMRRRLYFSQIFYEWFNNFVVFFCTSCEPHGMTIYWHIFLNLLNLWIWPFFFVLLCAYGVGIVLFCVFRLFFVLFSVV